MSELLAAEPISRWRCASYCLCTPLSKQHGHFERHRLGVWVKHSDVERMEREIEQLRLDLAQQTANTTTVLQAQHERDAAIEDVRRLRIALEDISTTFHGNPLKYMEAANRAVEIADSALDVEGDRNG